MVLSKCSLYADRCFCRVFNLIFTRFSVQFIMLFAKALITALFSLMNFSMNEWFFAVQILYKISFDLNLVVGMIV